MTCAFSGSCRDVLVCMYSLHLTMYCTHTIVGETVSCWRMLDGAPYYTRAAGTSDGQVRVVGVGEGRIGDLIIWDWELAVNFKLNISA